MTSAERNREMGIINLVTPEKQRQIDEIKDNLVKLRIPEELRNKILNEIDDFLKIWPQSIDWFDMPQEMRELAIEEMNIETKCKFVQCSRKCAEEVEKSKNYLTSIKVDTSGIFIGLARHSDFHYYLEFIEVNDSCEPKTMIVYKTDPPDNTVSDYIEKWTKTESGYEEEVRMKYFKEYITKYSRTIERIDIDDKLEISNVDWQQLTSLNYFYCDSYNCRDGEWMNLSQIKKINKCHLPETVFTFEEILQFEGQFYQIRSDDFNEENVEKYLKMFKNGEIHKNMENLCVWFEYLPEIEKCKKLAKGVDAFDFSRGDDVDNRSVEFRFLLNYERKSKCYCQVECDQGGFSFRIVSNRYEQVLENRRPLDF